jgi:hypothetical protein
MAALKERLRAEAKVKINDEMLKKAKPVEVR